MLVGLSVYAIQFGFEVLYNGGSAGHRDGLQIRSLPVCHRVDEKSYLRYQDLDPWPCSLEELCGKVDGVGGIAHPSQIFTFDMRIFQEQGKSVDIRVSIPQLCEMMRFSIVQDTVVKFKLARRSHLI